METFFCRSRKKALRWKKNDSRRSSFFLLSVMTKFSIIIHWFGLELLGNGNFASEIRNKNKFHLRLIKMCKRRATKKFILMLYLVKFNEQQNSFPAYHLNGIYSSNIFSFYSLPRLLLRFIYFISQNSIKWQDKRYARQKRVIINIVLS